MFDIFSLPEAKMPKDFLWGSGYAGHQVEGNNINSDRWFMEENYEEKSGMACNSYELWERDVEIALRAERDVDEVDRHHALVEASIVA
ncbi:MAG: hypothetical protein IIX94_04495, partial [Clostridia bacterium]|nr:hypothetical protein [Clostridia bacterium]